MTHRITDLRVQQAQSAGIIVGLPRAFAEDVAIIADVLSDCHIWTDVLSMFPGEVERHDPGTWKVPVAPGWWMLFGWQAPWGPVELRLSP